MIISQKRMRDIMSQGKATETGNTKLITVRVPHTLLPLIDECAQRLGQSRTWVLLSGAEQVVKDNSPTSDGQYGCGAIAPGGAGMG